MSPARTGGDRRSDRIEAHSEYLLGLIRRQSGITLLEIQERLIANCGERFSSSVIWRFFDRHGITFKKNWLLKGSACFLFLITDVGLNGFAVGRRSPRGI